MMPELNESLSMVEQSKKREADPYDDRPVSPNWGGSRPGAGRPHLDGSAPGDGERLRTYSITLPAAMARALRELGDGNLSAGIREMFALLRKIDPDYAIMEETKGE